jgi:hypothetical protein
VVASLYRGNHAGLAEEIQITKLSPGGDIVVFQTILPGPAATVRLLWIRSAILMSQAPLLPTISLSQKEPPSHSGARGGTLNGATKWPNAKELRRLGETGTACTPARVRQIFERIDAYMTEQPEFAAIGAKLLQE